MSRCRRRAHLLVLPPPKFNSHPHVKGRRSINDGLLLRSRERRKTTPRPYCGNCIPVRGVDAGYALNIPKTVINQGLLSAPQLEAIVYACQQHEFFLAGGDRAGYLIGDGAGVGKGRTVAGIIYENWLKGRKRAVWISVSADLKKDPIRDLKDIGAREINGKGLNEFKYERIKQDKFKNGVLFMTYSGLIGKTSKRRTEEYGLYDASRNLGIGTPFKTFGDSINSIEKRGIKVMELVAMDMKLRGDYIALQLSFKGVTFKIEDVGLTVEFVTMYNKSVDLWVHAMGKFMDAIDMLQLDGQEIKIIWSQFWGSHQRYFRYLCIAGKISRAIYIAKEDVIDGKCVVIGLQSTGEARTAEQFEKEGEPGSSSKFLEKQFPHGKVSSPPATRSNPRLKTENTNYHVKNERLDDSDDSDYEAGPSCNALVFFHTSADVSENDSDSSSSGTGSYNVGGRKRKLGKKPV
ncbi:Protein strawberry notch [Folsomia candida]|uniref:Protein strawberry notch n=1 Tax=Folsomia candida TaxID=158441 RepID=A0A226EJ85_FOLCA|nr:Protein strawberry notch [Folsomia candida]